MDTPLWRIPIDTAPSEWNADNEERLLWYVRHPRSGLGRIYALPDHSIYASGLVFKMLYVNKLPVLKAAVGAFCKKVTCTESKWNLFWDTTRREPSVIQPLKTSGHAARNRLFYDSEIGLFILGVLFNNVIRIVVVKLGKVCRLSILIL